MSATWDFLKGTHLRTLSTQIPRSQDVQTKYIKSKTKTDSRLDWIKQQLRSKDWILLKNDYPYDVQDGVVHYVFWYKDDISLEQTHQICTSSAVCVSRSAPRVNDVVVTTNTTANKSVPDISHHHVFIRTGT